MDKKFKGSITIEAAIVLPITILLIVSLSSFSRLFLVYNKVQFALNQTAKTISTYSYPLYYKTGLLNHSNSLESMDILNEAQVDYSKIMALAKDIGDLNDELLNGNQHLNIEDFKSLMNNEDLINIVKSTYKDIDQVSEIILEYYKEPTKLLQVLYSYIFVMGSDFFESEVSNLITETVFYSYLSINKDDKYSINESLSIDDIVFDTTIYSDMEHIKLYIKYNYKPMSFLGLSPSFHICQNAVIRGLTNGNEVLFAENNNTQNLWKASGEDIQEKNLNRGFKLEDMYIEEHGYTKVIGFSPIDAYNNDVTEPVCIVSLDTTSNTYKENPKQIQYQVRNQINAIINYKDESKSINNKEIEFRKSEFKSVIVVLIIPEDSLNNDNIKKIIEEIKVNEVENKTINNKKVFELVVYEGYGNGANV